MAEIRYAAPAPLGNDGNDGLTVLTPKEHIHSAIISATNGEDLTVRLANGPYRETVTNNYLFVSKPLNSIVIEMDTANGADPYGATIYAHSTIAQTRVIHFQSVAGSATVREVFIDSENFHSGTITTDSTNPVSSLTLDGTRFGRSTGKLTDFGHVLNLLITNGAEAIFSSTTTGGLFSDNTDNNAVFNVDDLTLTFEAPADLSAPLIDFQVTGTNSTFTLGTVTINQIMGNAVYGSAAGIRLRGFVSYDIDTILGTIDMNGYDNLGSVLEIGNSTILCNSLSVNRVSMVGGDATHRLTYGVKIGEESADGREYSLSNVEVGDITIEGANHAIMAGFIQDAYFHTGKVKDATIPLLSKGGIQNKFLGFDVIDPISYGCYAKNDTNSEFMNINVVLINRTPTSGVLRSGPLSLATPLVDFSTGTKFRNINVYNIVADTVFVYAVTGSDAEYHNNNFYSTVALTNEFNYQGSLIDSVTLFNALGNASGNIEVDPEPFFNMENEDYRLPYSSPLREAGKPFASNSVFKDRYNIDFNSSKPPIGSYSFYDKTTNGRLYQKGRLVA